MCDVNRVQGVTSSRGRLLTSALIPTSAVGGRRVNMKADRQRERDGRRGDKRVEEIRYCSPSTAGHLLKVIVMWFHSCTVKQGMLVK